jgi:type VI secretion system secreted protein Hcp
MLGTHYDKITLTLRKVTGGVQLPFLLFVMEEAIFSHYQTSGSEASEELHENMAINFARISMEYQVQGAKGAGVGKTTASWDINKGEKIA